MYCKTCEATCDDLKRHYKTSKHAIGVKLFGSYYKINRDVILKKWPRIGIVTETL